MTYLVTGMTLPVTSQVTYLVTGVTLSSPDRYDIAAGSYGIAVTLPK